MKLNSFTGKPIFLIAGSHLGQECGILFLDTNAESFLLEIFGFVFLEGYVVTFSGFRVIASAGGLTMNKDMAIANISVRNNFSFVKTQPAVLPDYELFS